MNFKQRIILVYSAIFIVLLTFYPPFHLELDQTSFTRFHLLFTNRYDLSMIFFPLLLIEYLVVIIVTGMLVLAFKDKK